MQRHETQPPAARIAQAAPELDRRGFIGRVGGIAAGVLGTFAGLSALDGRAARAIEITPYDNVERRETAYKIRVAAAQYEREFGIPDHPTNGDEELYPSRIGNFSKGLPHNQFGEVDPAAYDALLCALATGELSDFEAVPTAGVLRLVNPIGGLTFNIMGPDPAAISLPPPPPLASEAWAGQLAELYWMALLRDVPFSAYPNHPLAQEAAADLAAFPGYQGVTPATLFRFDYPGVKAGPFVSQFLLMPYIYDGVPVEQRVRTGKPNVDYLTHYGEWLSAQRGFPGGAPLFPAFDPVLRYVRSGRDLAAVVTQDALNTHYIKAMLVLDRLFGTFEELGLNEAVDDNNPYRNLMRQTGFASFGAAHLLQLLGAIHQAARATWYQKWNVHRFLRPEEGGGRVHVTKLGARDYPIDDALLEGSSVLPRIYELNRQRNLLRFGFNKGTYLLPTTTPYGSPAHPSFPSGHAFVAGACATLLKAWYDEDLLFPNPVKPSPDGLSLLPYVAGVDGPPLTIGGELNKLAFNVSVGRNMAGIHWRADAVGGNRQGEIAALRTLREDRFGYVEPFDGFELTRFDGTKTLA